MGQEIPVALWQGQYFDLRAVTADIDGAFWSAQGAERVARALQRGELALVHDAQALRVGAPVARPQALLCIGLNYAAHAAESGMPAPQQPVLFFKHPNTLVGPNDAVAVPPGAARMDWEVQLSDLGGGSAGAHCRLLRGQRPVRAQVSAGAQWLAVGQGEIVARLLSARPDAGHAR